jgi:DNA end-binding protein Ku
MRAGIWKGNISFGLLNIPVSLQTAEEDKGIHFSLLDKKTLSPVKFKRVSAKTGREIPYSQIVKGYEHEKGKFVVVTDRDFKAANVKATQAIDIENFVLLDEIDPMLFEKPYYVVPQKGGEKGYFLLRDALEKSKKVAIGKVVIRTKQHLAAVMPRGKYLILEMLRFSHQVLEAHEVDYLDKVKKPRYTPRELKMAESLIKEMTGEWDPDQYEDTYHNDQLKLIKQKVRGGETAEVEEPKREKTEGEVVDLLEVLRESLGRKKGRAA